ncbi:putative defense protein 3 [Lingula anatina]|uniref:Defense protein 3 n=1 Tax=Lingula anatina TaxID=7574 RepID=A0A1S3J069_LINAN|nr:putative defense protein 3 [Lingula anatina]|eukprot:XP_013403653.1 putative defense protein 3 [Lingula anatina]
MTTVQLLVLCVCLVSQASGYSSGPPELACISMVPSGHGTSGQRGPSPYTITPSVDQYAEGGSVTLTIKGKNGERFKGFFVQARRADPSLNVEEPIGRFDTISGSKILCDKALGNAISHSSGSDKSEVVLTWNAPTSFQGHLVFKATIVQTQTVFWDNEISALVRDPTAPDIVTTTMGTGPPIDLFHLFRKWKLHCG